jgi:hypothetical protein
MEETKEAVLLKLPELVKSFHEADATEKSAKKKAEPLKAEIKKLMSSASLEEFETDGLVASFSVQERTSTNETKLLNRLKELGLDNAIETVERPNSAVLETLIYDGKLDPATIADCFDTKNVEVLKVSKKKVKK